jgi:outer membrane protein assembly factor BamB
VAKLDPTGALLWQSPPLDDGTCSPCQSPLALTADDDAVIAMLTGPMPRHTTVYELDAHGQIAWQRDLPGIFTEGPVVAHNGTIRIVFASMATNTAKLVSLSAKGDVLWTADLNDDFQQTGDDDLVVGLDGVTVARTFNNIVAVDATGAVLWKMPVYPNGAYSAAVDAHGTLVVLAGDVVGIDAHTGMKRWSVSGPGFDGGMLYFASSMVLGASRSVVGATFGGALFLARDP